MQGNLIKKYYILQFAILLSSNVFSQNSGANRHYYQDELDYLPHFQSFQLAGGKMEYKPGLEFDEVLEEILNSCSDKKYTLISWYGTETRLSGISPIGASKDNYFVIELDENGKVAGFDVYNSSNAEQIEQCISEALKMSITNPGLKERQPVKCYFVYIFR